MINLIKLTEVLFKLDNIFGVNKYIICGSTGLCLHGLLNRNPHDLDIITFKDFYSSGTDEFDNTLNRINAISDKFYIEDLLVKVFGLEIDGFHVDVMYKNVPTEYKKMNIGNLQYFVENPKFAIEVKKKYVEGLVTNKEKHYKDLQELNNFPEDDITF